jgi:hypothetical protein
MLNKIDEFRLELLKEQLVAGKLDLTKDNTDLFLAGAKEAFEVAKAMGKTVELMKIAVNMEKSLAGKTDTEHAKDLTLMAVTYIAQFNKAHRLLELAELAYKAYKANMINKEKANEPRPV